jgi:protocatechuate 3,4-dioxygenase beta subunit
MGYRTNNRFSRRQFLQLCLGLAGPAVLAACARWLTDEEPDLGEQQVQPTTRESLPEQEISTPDGQAESLRPTPTCGDEDDPTPPQTAGPFYTPNSPLRTSLLEPEISGTRILLSGTVLGTDCQPVPGALVDFWHADDRGVYDNQGYRLRGHQFTDDKGRYHLETIVPGLYPGRTRHFHVNVQAPNQPVLTTQLYFPGEEQNARDRIFNPQLVIDVRDEAEDKVATFDFVLASV